MRTVFAIVLFLFSLSAASAVATVGSVSSHSKRWHAVEPQAKEVEEKIPAIEEFVTQCVLLDISRRIYIDRGVLRQSVENIISISLPKCAQEIQTLLTAYERCECVNTESVELHFKEMYLVELTKKVSDRLKHAGH